MRISDTETSSVILSQTMKFKKLKVMTQNLAEEGTYV